MTESEIVERVARAMCVADGGDPDARAINEWGWFYDLWQGYEERARMHIAAAAAYREATGE